jgi:hypothetical protein
MDFYSVHPYLYQLLHPWHWLTYGQNAMALGVLLATLVNLLAVLVLIQTLLAVNRQAKAADRQAEAAEAQAAAARKQTEVSEQQRLAAERAATAAEEQVLAAKSATAVSEAQRIAAEQAAMAEREHSELIRQQTLANLRPILVIIGERHSSGMMIHFIENHGEGVALVLKASYRGGELQDIAISADILGPNHRTYFAFRWEALKQYGMQVRYESQDGRFFVTVVSVENDELRQNTLEVDANGGALSHPRIPKGL